MSVSGIEIFARFTSLIGLLPGIQDSNTEVELRKN